MYEHNLLFQSLTLPEIGKKVIYKFFVVAICLAGCPYFVVYSY